MTPATVAARAAAGVTLAALTGCTGAQLEAWTQWHATDPAAAVEYANRPEVRAEIADAATQGGVPGVAASVWDALSWCESGGNWATNTGNGYSGGLQFTHGAWNAYGGREFAPRAYQASREAQIVVAERILADVGWRAWPACSRRLGLR